VARLRLDRDVVEAAVLGGAVLGGGGGGSIALGRRNGHLVVELGAPDLVELDDLAPDAVLATVSAVGSPAAATAFALPVHFVRAVELLSKHSETHIQGLISNECGGLATVNGWLQAAALGLPVVDAPCNGRAHPTGLMGSIGLHRVEGYVSLQTAVGGDPTAGRYVELFSRGSLEKASALVLQASVQAGGLVAVARNPVSVEYARDQAAPGAIAQAICVGRAMLERQSVGVATMVDAACEALHGGVAARGQVEDVRLETVGGLDVGAIRVRSGDRQTAELTFWNEYMTLDILDADSAVGPRRVGTFPDLLATFDLSSGLPLASAEVAVGQEVAVVHVDRRHLILGAGMRDPALLRPIEQATGRDVLKYVFPQAADLLSRCPGRGARLRVDPPA
jgi:DUF917 family protein